MLCDLAQGENRGSLTTTTKLGSHIRLADPPISCLLTALGLSHTWETRINTCVNWECLSPRPPGLPRVKDFEL